jgi:hypothetical protein
MALHLSGSPIGGQDSIYYLLPTYLLPTTYYLLLTTYYSLLTTHYLLLTTYYLLPTTYYLLLTTYYRWSDSICLFHARFGGECLPVEFANNRPTAQKRSQPTPEFLNMYREQFYDKYDSALYLAVEARFQREWRELNLSWWKCLQICSGIEGPGGVLSDRKPRVGRSEIVSG